jgi:D-alanyl-D-alanine carboxypeptidase/D-alanyl-D-alanine-endopeptidase (penicillin-binding protein 4)
MNKFSNNFVAEMLTKGLAVEPGKRATLKQGVEIIKEELKKIGLDEKQITFINPSGLTRDNKFSAASLNKVLTAIKDDFSIFPAFVDSLPIAGIDGTLKKRFKGTDGEGWIRAKTGYLNNVVALAGYAGRRDGQVLTFSFLYNGPRDEGIVREAFDQILISRLK